MRRARTSTDNKKTIATQTTTLNTGGGGGGDQQRRISRREHAMICAENKTFHEAVQSFVHQQSPKHGVASCENDVATQNENSTVCFIPTCKYCSTMPSWRNPQRMNCTELQPLRLMPQPASEPAEQSKPRSMESAERARRCARGTYTPSSAFVA